MNWLASICRFSARSKSKVVPLPLLRLFSSPDIGAQERDGFEQLLASVALGEVGIVLSRELSRLSRTDVGADFCIGLGSCSAGN